MKDFLTMVQMKKSTANLLKKERLTERESYDEIVNRLLDKKRSSK